jgi:hypothetical protein
MNMQILKPSRKRLQPGDVFAYRIKGHDFGYGRVIRTDCLFAGGRDTILIYIYNAFSPVKERIPELSKARLLLTPQLTNRLAWSRGYFETIESRPLGPEDVLKVHCFYTDIYVRRRYLDEDERRLRRRSEPCGSYGLSSFMGLDIKISMALGIEPSPDTLPPPPPPEHVQERRRQEYNEFLAEQRRRRRAEQARRGKHKRR